MWTVPAIAGLEHGGDDVIERVSLIDQGATEAATTPSGAPSSFVAGLLAALTASAAGTATAPSVGAGTSPSVAATPSTGASTPASATAGPTENLAAAATTIAPRRGHVAGTATGVPHTIDSGASAISWIPGGAIAAAAGAGDAPNGTVATDEPPVPTIPAQSSSAPVPGRDGTPARSAGSGRRRMDVRLLVDAHGTGTGSASADTDGPRVDVDAPPAGRVAIDSMPAPADTAVTSAAVAAGLRTVAGSTPPVQRSARTNTLRATDVAAAPTTPAATGAAALVATPVADPSAADGFADGASLNALVAAGIDAPATGRTSHAGSGSGSGERSGLDDVTATVGRDLDSAASSAQSARSGWSAISRAAGASATTPVSTTTATTATTAAPKSSIGMANVDRVRFARESAPAREIQRLAIDLDGARVAVRVDAHRMSVDVVSDPAGELGNGWAKHVEKSLDQAVRAQSTPTGQGDAHMGNPHGSTRGQAEANDRREQHQATIDGTVDDTVRANRWAAATAQLIGMSS